MWCRRFLRAATLTKGAHPYADCVCCGRAPKRQLFDEPRSEGMHACQVRFTSGDATADRMFETS